ncbi:MAG TPA: MotA/TolQ/ExbB proton channel family protein [Bacteroidales bacterium]|nr:MotA/TolQ/ExbB proton channel family protein [Bacteroidales bacterium]
MFLSIYSLVQPVAEPGRITSWFDLIMKGGVIMIPIFLLSFITVYLFIERYFYVQRVTSINPVIVQSVIQELNEGNLNKAKVFAQSDQSSIGRIIESGLVRIGRPVTEIESNLESATNLEITKMEKNTGYLGIIAGVAPMLGFIGTISGIIKIFYSISLADNISIGIISEGLYQKMICSGTGLIVGVIAYSAYHILQMKIDRYTINVQENLIKLLNALYK